MIRGWSDVLIILAVGSGLLAVGVCVIGIRSWAYRGRWIRELHITSNGVRLTTQDGATSNLAWGEIVEVSIVTSHDDLLDVGMTWQFRTMDGSVYEIENKLLNTAKLLEHLDGYDRQAVENAMTATSRKRFTCWNKQQ